MIRIIGMQRFLLLLILGGMLAGLFLYDWYVLKPDLLKHQRELSANHSAINEMRTNMDNIVQGMALFEEQKSQFEDVRQYGFFDLQDRVATRKRLNAMQKESRLMSAKYTIKQAVIEEGGPAEEAGYKLLNTEIIFSLSGLEDMDIYNFIYLLNYGFPGQISIDSISISRDKEVTEPLLRQIGVGGSEPIVKANLKVRWHTMVEDKSLSASDREGVQ